MDINSDGLMDLYIAGAMNPDNRENRLYVNQGLILMEFLYLKSLPILMGLMIKAIVWVQLL